MERVEGVEKLLLRAVLAGEELDVVDQQHVDRPVLGPELAHPGGLDRGDDLVHELLRGEVGHALLGELAVDLVSDGVHQVGLAEPDAAVEEQRVVALPRGVGDRLRRRVGEPRVAAHHEGAELELLVELAVRNLDGLFEDLIGEVEVLGVGHGRALAVLGDDEVDLDLGSGHRLEGLLDQPGEAILEPVLGELARDADPKDAAVRRKQHRVLQPRLVARSGELEPQLVLDGSPDLVLIHPVFDSS